MFSVKINKSEGTLVLGAESQIKDSDDYIFENLKKRCNELIEKHPDRSKLFENYIKKQEEENNILETRVVCLTMLIRKR